MTTLLLCISTITKVCSVSSPHEKNVVSEQGRIQEFKKGGAKLDRIFFAPPAKLLRTPHIGQ